MSEKSPKPPKSYILKLLLNGLLLRCPQCAKGRILKGFLTRADQCHHCGESFDDLNADDGPAWFVMIFVGVLLVPVLIVLGVNDLFPMWGNILAIGVATTLLTLVLLPPTKGVFIVILWHLRQKDK